MATFRRNAKVDADRGDDARVADAFALLYAALKLAQQYKVLPADLRAGPHILACYRLHLETARSGLTGLEALQALVQHPDAIDLDAERKPKRQRLRKSSLYVEEDEGGIILSIRVGTQKRYCRRWAARTVPADLIPFLQPANDRQATEKRIGGVKDRFYRFYLPHAAVAE